MAKSKEKIKAIKLREKGQSIKAIARHLNVSPGSVSVWCRDVSLTFAQIQTLQRNARDPNYGKRLQYLTKVKNGRLKKITDLKNKGIEEIGILDKDALFIAGIALYWAEGFKKDSQAGFANLDPYMAKFFIKWITECCGRSIHDLSIRVTVNESHSYRINNIQNYWSSFLDIPLFQFQKPYYQKIKWKKEYKNHSEYYGVIRIKVRKSTDLLRKINGWIEGLRLNAN